MNQKTDYLTIEHAQQNQPWTVPYSDTFKEISGWSMPHLHGTHAVLHAMKSLGKIAAIFERLDHQSGEPTYDEHGVIRSMAADLCTIALRLANLYGFSLATALQERVLEKNGVDITDSLKVAAIAVPVEDG